MSSSSEGLKATVSALQASRLALSTSPEVWTSAITPGPCGDQWCGLGTDDRHASNYFGDESEVFCTRTSLRNEAGGPLLALDGI